MPTPPFDPRLAQLRTLAVLQEHQFRSEVPLVGPLIAGFRALWNSVATRWYVRPLMQQQSEFNQQIVALLTAQVTAADAAEAERAQGLARVASCEVQLGQHEARLAATEAGLTHREAQLEHHEERLVTCEVRLAAWETQLANAEAHAGRNEQRLAACEMRMHHHDAWLIDQDREQSAAIGDLSETALRLVQANRRLAALERRLAVLESRIASTSAEPQP
jgi:chromosome segregation ATPase